MTEEQPWTCDHTVPTKHTAKYRIRLNNVLRLNNAFDPNNAYKYELRLKASFTQKGFSWRFVLVGVVWVVRFR